MRIRLRLWIVAGVTLLVAWRVPANPLRCPERLINGQAVNLMPLFQWWTNHHGARPLSAWVHITGLVAGTNGWGWVVQARIEGAGRSDAATEEPRKVRTEGKILLRNPPVQDQANYEQLSGYINALNRQRAVVAGKETEAKNRADALAKEQNVSRRARAQLTRQLNEVQKEAKAELKIIDQRIKDAKTNLVTYTTEGHYTLDCFALDLSQEANGMPVYDHGVVR